MYRLCPHCSQPTFWVGEVMGANYGECPCGYTAGQKPSETVYKCERCGQWKQDCNDVDGGKLVCGECIEANYEWCDECMDYRPEEIVKDGVCRDCTPDEKRRVS